MRIVSLNTWGGRLFEPLLPYLQTTDADILCLQEIIHTPTTQKPWLIYRDGGADLPQRANLLAELSAVLPDHLAIFCPAARGDLWDSDHRVDSFWGLATFVRKDLPIIGQQQSFVHGSFSPFTYGEHPRSRTAHAVRVFDYVQNRALTIAHMHGLREPEGKHDTPQRLAQAERFASMITAVASEDDHVIACGDFNVTPDSATFPILGKLGLRDLVTARDFTDTRTSHYAKSGRFADYMLVSPGLLDATFDIVAKPEVSDHRPLILDIS